MCKSMFMKKILIKAHLVIVVFVCCLQLLEVRRVQITTISVAHIHVVYGNEELLEDL